MRHGAQRWRIVRSAFFCLIPMARLADPFGFGVERGAPASLPAGPPPSWRPAAGRGPGRLEAGGSAGKEAGGPKQGGPRTGQCFGPLVSDRRSGERRSQVGVRHGKWIPITGRWPPVVPEEATTGPTQAGPSGGGPVAGPQRRGLGRRDRSHADRRAGTAAGGDGRRTLAPTYRRSPGGRRIVGTPHSGLAGPQRVRPACPFLPRADPLQARRRAITSFGLSIVLFHAPLCS